MLYHVLLLRHLVDQYTKYQLASGGTVASCCEAKKRPIWLKSATMRHMRILLNSSQKVDQFSDKEEIPGSSPGRSTF